MAQSRTTLDPAEAILAALAQLGQTTAADIAKEKKPGEAKAEPKKEEPKSEEEKGEEQAAKSCHSE